MEWRAAVRRWKGSQEIGLVVLVLLCTACAFRGIPPAAPKAGDAIVIEARPVTLRRDGGGTESVGRLRYRGGLLLRAAHRGFGGWSDLWVAPDGTALRAVSDEGHWLTARIVFDRVDNFEGIAVSRGRQGGPLLWLISDDNFLVIQDTLLLAFELLP